MSAIQELADLLSGRSRVIVISERDVDLGAHAGANRLFVLSMVEGSHAAGGRGAGFGERRVTKVSLFASDGSGWSKLFESGEEAKVGEFEVPYYVSRIPMVLQDGTESMGYGAVDPELVAEYSKRAHSST